MRTDICVLMRNKCGALLFILIVLSAGVSFAASADSGDGVWLMTPDEAAMPAPDGHSGLRGGAPFDVGREIPNTGPTIEVVKPEDGGQSHIPFEIEVNFSPRNAPVDVSTVRVYVLKFVTVNITERVEPFISERGVHIPEAKMPPGKYKVRVRVEDEDGGRSVRNIRLKVMKR